MIIYTFQPQSLIDKVMENGFVAVDLPETNVYKQIQSGGNQQVYDAYFWMARKLSQKTGLWMKSVYGDNLDIPKDADGDYIDGNGEKLPLFPFWGWYLIGGKNTPPDSSYAFDSGNQRSSLDWNQNSDKTMLVTLDIPEEYVLLSDINAWYCVLEGRPCYEYEDEETEERLLADCNKRLNQLKRLRNPAKQREMAESIYQETVSSWDNIFRLEGRRLKDFIGIPEKHDIQAAFPVLDKRCIVSVDDVEIPNYEDDPDEDYLPF